MNVELGTEADQFPFWKFMNGIFVAVRISTEDSPFSVEQLSKDLDSRSGDSLEFNYGYWQVHGAVYLGLPKARSRVKMGRHWYTFVELVAVSVIPVPVTSELH
jgi:hypothetical protein